VLRLSLTLWALVLVALLAVPTALGVRVHVRVEGKTTTIFGASEPRLESSTSALDALEAASLAGEFYYHVQRASFGAYVDQIGRFVAGGTNGWVFKVNGVSPPVGAEQVQLREGDRVLWYWAQFGIVPGGPPTLLLQRQAKGCYRVLAQEDSGARRPATGAVLVVDGRRIRTKAARACPGAHRGLVRAQLAGAVRSNALA